MLKNQTNIHKRIGGISNYLYLSPSAKSCKTVVRRELRTFNGQSLLIQFTYYAYSLFLQVSNAEKIKIHFLSMISIGFPNLSIDLKYLTCSLYAHNCHPSPPQNNKH